MGRRAVAATLVSFVVFTSLLLANSALYSAENSSLDAAVLSAAQARESAYAGVLVGLSSYGSLAAIQGYLGSNPLDCTSPGPYLDSLAGSQHETGSGSGVAYVVDSSWSFSSAPATGEGSPLIPGFGGYVPGELNLEVDTSLSETYSGHLPSYSTQTLEAVHLPVPLSSAISACLGALADLHATLSGLPYCNSTGFDGAVEVARSAYPSLASYSVGGAANPASPGCAVDYWVTTTVEGLQGVTGEYQWTVRGEGGFETGGIP